MRQTAAPDGCKIVIGVTETQRENCGQSQLEIEMLVKYNAIYFICDAKIKKNEQKTNTLTFNVLSDII